MAKNFGDKIFDESVDFLSAYFTECCRKPMRETNGVPFGARQRL
jgi:hypothetical protein